MNEELIQIFAECSDAIAQNRLTLDDCLARHPQHRDELAELLAVTTQMQAMPTAVPTAEFRQNARTNLLAHLTPRATANGAAALGAATAGVTLAQRWQKLWHALTQRWSSLPMGPSLAVGAALLLIFVFVIGLWLRPSAEPTNLAQNNRPTRAVDEANNNTAEDETDIAAPLAETAASPATPDDTFTMFVPLISSPLALTAQTAALAVDQGVVELQNADGTWTAVTNLTTAAVGQRIRTGAFSTATLTFYDGSQATLGPNTELSLDQVDAQLPGDGFRTIVMTQWQGESKHDVSFRDDSGSRYEVMTPNGSGRARGTSFEVLVSVNLLTQVIVTEGRVDVTHLNVTVIVIAGQTSLVPPEQPPSEPHFIVTGEGEVTAVGPTWTIGGQTFTTTDSTLIVGNPQIGDIVAVSGYLLPDGTLVATRIVLRHDAPDNRFTLTGEVATIGADEWVVAGQAIAVDDETAVDETLAVGDVARVYGRILADGTLLARRIDRVDDAHPFEFTGVVQQIGSDSWLVSGLTIALDERTEVKDEIVVGDVVKVEGVILADNTWLAGEIKLAEEDGRFEFTGPVNNIDPWVVAGLPFATDAFTEIDDGIAISDLVYVEGQILADGTWLATEIRRLSDDDALTFHFVGTVERIEPWLISGLPIAVDANTRIDDRIEVGSLVRVRGLIRPNGDWLATQIVRLDRDVDLVGCSSVTTVVVSVNGSVVTLEGLPPVTLADDTVITGDLQANAIITVTVCASHDGSIIIVSIIVVHTAPPPPPPPGTNPPPPSGGGGSYDITGNNENVSLTCNGHTVTVRGNANTVTLSGNCSSIVVRGNANTIFYQAAGSITNTGNNNSIQQR